MSAITVNAFPPLHAFNSSRSWFVACIVLLHLGFFWALTHGVTIGDMKIKRDFVVDFLPAPPRPLPPPAQIQPDEPRVSEVYVPNVDVPVLRHDEDSTAPQQVTGEPRPAQPLIVKEAPGSGPIIIEPKTDPRFPFTQPAYPNSEIRLGHEGTVLLRVQILPNGRVGEIQVEESSGFVKLDESAAREARSYRMKPGMQNGVATVMWVRVPIKFQLKNN